MVKSISKKNINKIINLLSALLKLYKKRFKELGGWEILRDGLLDFLLDLVRGLVF